MARLMAARLVASSAIVVLLALVGTALAQHPLNLTILHTSDVRGRLLPVRGELDCEFTIPNLNDVSTYKFLAPNCVLQGACQCAGGVAARVHYIRAVREREGADRVLVVDVANHYYGTLFYQRFRESGSRSRYYFNEAPYDAMSIGSNEFFSGTLALRTYLEGVNPTIPTVLSNMDWTADVQLSACKKAGNVPCVLPWAVVERSGTKVGLLGAVRTTLRDISSPGPDIVLPADVTRELRRQIFDLQQVHPTCEVIILLSSLQEPMLLDVARNVQHIDVIVSSHDLPSYPHVEINLVTRMPVYIVSSDYMGSKIGHLEVEFDALGHVARVGGSKVPLTLTFSSDPGTGHALVPGPNPLIQNDPMVWQSLMLDVREVELFKRTVVGAVTAPVYGEGWDDATCVNSQPTTADGVCPAGSTPLNAPAGHCCPFGAGDAQGRRCVRFPQCAPGPDTDFCCASGAGSVCCPAASYWLLHSCRHADCPMGRLVTDAMLESCPDCDAAFNNAGSIRASIPNAGNVTLGDLLAVFPFKNSIAMFKVRGTVIVSMLQHSIAGYTPQDGAGKFLQVSGIRFAFNPVSRAVLRAQVRNRVTGKFENVNANKYYKLATNNFVFGGGDGFTMLAPNALDADIFGPMVEDALRGFIARHSPYTPGNVSACLGQHGDPVRAFDQTGCRILKAPGESMLGCPRTGEDWCASGGYGPDFRPITPCTECSGFGTCSNATFQCTCLPMTYEPFAGDVFHRGADCSDQRRQWSVGVPATVAMYAVSGLTMGTAVLLSLFFLRHANHRLVNNASPLFCHLLDAGGVVGAATSIMFMQPPSWVVCNGSLILLCACFALLYAPLFAKTYRVHKLLNNPRLRRIRITDGQLLKFVGLLLVAQLLAAGGFMLVSPLRPAAELLPEGMAWEYALMCGSGPSDADNADLRLGVAIVAAANAVMMCWGIYLAFCVRNVPANFNESRFICMAIYNFSGTAAITLPVILAVQGNPTFRMVWIHFGLNYVCLFTMLVLALPKWYAIRNDVQTSDVLTASERQRLTRRTVPVTASPTEAVLLLSDSRLAAGLVADALADTELYPTPESRVARLQVLITSVFRLSQDLSAMERGGLVRHGAGGGGEEVVKSPLLQTGGSNSSVELMNVYAQAQAQAQLSPDAERV